MVLLGGLEILAAGYLLAEHSKHKKERRLLEEQADELRRQQDVQHQQQRRQRHQRRYSDSERDERRRRHEGLANPRPKRERKESKGKLTGTSAAPGRDSSKRRDEHRPSASRPQQSTAQLAPPLLPTRHTRPGSAPPPGYEGYPHHNGAFAPPPSAAGASYNANAYLPPNHYPQPPPLPISPPALHPPPYAASPSYAAPATPSSSWRPVPAPQSSYVPPPPGIWELPVGNPSHPNPGRPHAAPQRPYSPHVRFADGLGTKGQAVDPPPPYREF